MHPQIILTIILSIVLFDFAVSTILEILNTNHQNKPLPESLQDIYDKTAYQKSIDYQKAHTNFGFIQSGLSTIITLAALYTGLFGVYNDYLRSFTTQPIVLSLLFFGGIFLFSELIGLPFQYYNTFVIEEKFGFNKSTIQLFIADKLKGYLLTLVIGGVLGTIFLYLVNWLGVNFWWVFWAIATSFIFIINVFYTSLILPLFNKLTPLEDGELKQKIQEYCQKVSFPLTNVFVIDGSKRSSKANAFFSGIGKKKKIVLYDTLINENTTDELVAVLAHEVGHFKKKHIVVGFAISIVQTGAILFILSQFIFNNGLSLALGASSTYIHINLIAFGLLFSPISQLLGICFNLISRKNEYEADDYAKNTFGGQYLITALKKLSRNNLSNLLPHPAYVFVNYSHPPLWQRLKNLAKS